MQVHDHDVIAALQSSLAAQTAEAARLKAAFVAISKQTRNDVKLNQLLQNVVSEACKDLGDMEKEFMESSSNSHRVAAKIQWALPRQSHGSRISAYLDGLQSQTSIRLSQAGRPVDNVVLRDRQLEITVQVERDKAVNVDGVELWDVNYEVLAQLLKQLQIHEDSLSFKAWLAHVDAPDRPVDCSQFKGSHEPRSWLDAKEGNAFQTFGVRDLTTVLCAVTLSKGISSVHAHAKIRLPGGGRCAEFQMVVELDVDGARWTQRLAAAGVGPRSPPRISSAPFAICSSRTRAESGKHS